MYDHKGLIIFDISVHLYEIADAEFLRKWIVSPLSKLWENILYFSLRKKNSVYGLVAMAGLLKTLLVTCNQNIRHRT